MILWHQYQIAFIVFSSSQRPIQVKEHMPYLIGKCVEIDIEYFMIFKFWMDRLYDFFFNIKITGKVFDFEEKLFSKLRSGIGVGPSLEIHFCALLDSAPVQK